MCPFWQQPAEGYLPTWVPSPLGTKLPKQPPRPIPALWGRTVELKQVWRNKRAESQESESPSSYSLIPGHGDICHKVIPQISAPEEYH